MEGLDLRWLYRLRQINLDSRTTGCFAVQSVLLPDLANTTFLNLRFIPYERVGPAGYSCEYAFPEENPDQLNLVCHC
jgi:hypothetical protein